MKSLASFFVILASAATYFSSEGKGIFYFIFLILFFASIIQRKSLRPESKAPLVIALGYLFASFMSLVLNFNVASTDMIQSLAYPIILILLVLGGWRLIFDAQGFPAKLIILFFTTNALVAFLSISDIVNNLPLFGEITRGRFIFGTTTQSSAGLIWNVNYFSITQLIGFWLSYFIFSTNRLSTKWLFPIALIAISIPLGSSRSVTLSFITSILLFFYLSSPARYKKPLTVIFVSSIVFSSSFYTYIINNDELFISLRLDRGLNGRDELWSYGFSLFLDSPLFGIGSVEKIQQLLTETAGLNNTTVQNSILFSMVRLGAFGTTFVLLFFTCAFYKFLSNKNKTKHDSALFCCLFALTMDSMVRSYSLGGVGLSPFIMSLIASYFSSWNFSSPQNIATRPQNGIPQKPWP